MLIVRLEDIAGVLRMRRKNLNSAKQSSAAAEKSAVDT